MLVQAIVSAYVVFIFMRFALRSAEELPHITGAGCELGEPVEINFRLMRESQTAVRDAHAYVQALPKVQGA